MVMKQITLFIPDDYFYTNKFTEYENKLMLIIGTEAVIEFKKTNINNTTDNYYQDDILQKLKQIYKDGNSEEIEKIKKEKNEQQEYYKEKIGRLENDLFKLNIEILNKEKNIDLIVNEKIRELETNHFEKVKELELNSIEKIKFENEKNILLQKEIHDVKENMSLLLLKQHEQENLKLKNDIVNINSSIEELKNKSNKSNNLGKQGEEYLHELLCNTFSVFEDFEIINTTKIGHCGDFQLKFKKFNILVDSKNFENTGVKNTDILKLKKDIKSNQHFKIAWLVSLKNPIHCHNKAPFEIEIDDDVLYIYINSLKLCEDPAGLLKTCYFFCCEIFDIFLDKEDNNILLQKYKKKDVFIKNTANKLLKNIKELKMSLKQMEDNIVIQENLVKEFIADEIMGIKEEQTFFVKKWWDENFIKDENGKLKINTVYKLFVSKNENHKIDADEFKTIVKSFLDDTNISVLKTNKTAFNIFGWKQCTGY
jgi:hypothetical protein